MTHTLHLSPMAVSAIFFEGIPVLMQSSGWPEPVTVRDEGGVQCNKTICKFTETEVSPEKKAQPSQLFISSVC